VWGFLFTNKINNLTSKTDRKGQAITYLQSIRDLPPSTATRNARVSGTIP